MWITKFMKKGGHYQKCLGDNSSCKCESDFFTINHIQLVYNEFNGKLTNDLQKHEHEHSYFYAKP